VDGEMMSALFHLGRETLGLKTDLTMPVMEAAEVFLKEYSRFSGLRGC
jgi:hypothetical protein